MLPSSFWLCELLTDGMTNSSMVRAFPFGCCLLFRGSNPLSTHGLPVLPSKAIDNEVVPCQASSKEVAVFRCCKTIESCPGSVCVCLFRKEFPSTVCSRFFWCKGTDHIQQVKPARKLDAQSPALTAKEFREVLINLAKTPTAPI